MASTAPTTTDKKDVVPSAYRDRYKATGGTNGDFIATNLQRVGKDGLGALGTIKSENGIEADRWANFNPGMQRMNLANVLRGRYLKGEVITILGKQYSAKHQLEDYSGKIEDNPRSLNEVASYLELTPGDRTVSALSKLLFSPPKITAEERAATKAAKDAEKAAEKQRKLDEKAAAKATADAVKMKVAQEAAALKEKTKADKAAEKASKAEAARIAKNPAAADAVDADPADAAAARSKLA